MRRPQTGLTLLNYNLEVTLNTVIYSTVNILHVFVWLSKTKAETCCLMPSSTAPWRHLAVNERIATIRGLSRVIQLEIQKFIIIYQL